MTKIKNILFACFYLGFLWFIPWNFYTFFAALTLGWFLLLVWLPFNKKERPTPFGIKIILFVMQIVFMLILSFALWQLLIPIFVTKQPLTSETKDLASVPTPAQALLKQEDLSTPLQTAENFSAAPALPSVPTPDKLEEKALALPITQEGMLIKEQLFPSPKAKHTEPVGAPNTSPQKFPFSELEKHPAYNQAFSKVNKQIQKEDLEDASKVLPKNKINLLKNQAPIVRAPLILQWVQNGIQHNKQQLENTRAKDLSSQEINAIKKQLLLQENIFNQIKQRHTQDYLNQAIESELKHYTKGK